MSDVDIFVGQRIRARRLELGKSQGDLAKGVGVNFQQIQKYESGANRVSASRLWAIAGALQTDVQYFFLGAEKAAASAANGASAPHDPRSVHLMRDFRKLPEAQKSAIIAIVNSMAASQPSAKSGHDKAEA